MAINFTSLVVGERARITSLARCSKAYRQKLLSMGLTTGTEFTLDKIAPLGCPVAINVAGSLLCLRKQEATLLELELLSDEQ